jgi:hypothetical protein
MKGNKLRNDLLILVSEFVALSSPRRIFLLRDIGTASNILLPRH